MAGTLATFATRSIGLFWRENGSCSSRWTKPVSLSSSWVEILDGGDGGLNRSVQWRQRNLPKSVRTLRSFLFASFLVAVVVDGCIELTISVPMQYDDFAWKTDDLIENARRNRRTQVHQIRDTPVVEWKRPYSKNNPQVLKNLVIKNLFIG